MPAHPLSSSTSTSARRLTACVCPSSLYLWREQGYHEVEEWEESAAADRLGRAVWRAVSVKQQQRQQQQQRSVTPVVPLPFIGEVAEELEQCRSCKLWAVPRVELPDSMSAGHDGPKHWSMAMATPLYVDRLSLQLVSLPCHDEVIDGRKTIVELEGSLEEPPRQMRSEAAFWHREEHPDDSTFASRPRAVQGVDGAADASSAEGPAAPLRPPQRDRPSST